MDNTNGTSTGKRGRKEFRKLVTARLATALFDMHSGTNEKKFKAAVKRAGKLLANDLFTKNKKEKNKKEEQIVPVEAETIGA